MSYCLCLTTKEHNQTNTITLKNRRMNPVQNGVEASDTYNNCNKKPFWFEEQLKHRAKSAAEGKFRPVSVLNIKISFGELLGQEL
jgi:hypothetical protein